MKYNIPRKFTIGGQEINVIIKKTIEVEGAIGAYKSMENEIHIQTHMDGKALPKSQVEQTFYHEYVHCLFDQCRQPELCSNESLVDLMGEFLYQSLGKRLK